jgi:2-C-methyl-D-erythritol 4-phosphate cytidylyltransferase
MSSDRFTTAIIVAAGGSTRMGYRISKQLIPLCGRPAIEYTIRAFQDCDRIDEIIVVARPQDIEDIAHIAFNFQKVMTVTAGGADRAESVRRGIRAASKKACYYAIHDGARPLVTNAEIEHVVDAAFVYGAATLGTPVTDTLKVISGQANILSTPDRASLYAVQTPQVFERELYLRAVEHAVSENLSVTDDCTLVEAIGAKVKVIRGEYTNIKLTTPADLIFAEAILARRKV